jgi:hypothetical protein
MRGLWFLQKNGVTGMCLSLHFFLLQTVRGVEV